MFGCCRVVFNDAVRLRNESFRAGIRLSDTEIQRRVITVAKTTEEREWLREVPSVALVQAVGDARRAFKNFVDSCTGKRRGRKVGRPRFRSRKNGRQSFRLTRNGFTLRSNGKVCVAKVGEVRVRWSRPLPSVPSSVTIIREPDGRFYASFVVEVAKVTLLDAVGSECGVDLGLARLATIATNEGGRVDIANPKHLHRKTRKLARLQRQLSRKAPDAANRAEFRRRVAVQHLKVARARRDYHHKQALRLVRENQTIYVEDLNIVGMIRNRRLARAIADAGWRQFVQVISGKCEQYGRRLVRVDRWLPSSKTCSECGYVMDSLPLGVRAWACPVCNHVHDRDFNAARNILAAGRAERLNASHEGGAIVVDGCRGAPVRPPEWEARSVEAGSNSDAA